MAAESLDPTLLRIVRGVTISEHETVGKTVYYVIDVTTSQGHYWQVNHRFSDFDELADDICQDIGLSHRAELPGKLPRKSLFSGEKVIEKRKKKLSKFLYALIQDQRCLESNVLANFLCFNAVTKNMPDGPVKTADDNTFYSHEALNSKLKLDHVAPPSPPASNKPSKPAPPGGFGTKPSRPPPPGSAGRPAPPRKGGPPSGGRGPPPPSGAGKKSPPPTGRAPPPSVGRKPPPSSVNRAPPPSVNNSSPAKAPPPQSSRGVPPPIPQNNTSPMPPKTIGGPTFKGTPTEGRKPPIPIVKGKKIRKPTNYFANSGSSKNLDADISSADQYENSHEQDEALAPREMSDQKRPSGRKAFPGGAVPDLAKIKLRSTKNNSFALGAKKPIKKEPEANSGMTELQRKMAARRQKIDSGNSGDAFNKKRSNKSFALGMKKNDSSSSIPNKPKPKPVNSKPPLKPTQASKPSWANKESSTPSWVNKKQQLKSNSTPPWVKKKQEPKQDPGRADFVKHPTPPIPNSLASVPPRFKKKSNINDMHSPDAPVGVGLVGGRPPSVIEDLPPTLKQSAPKAKTGPPPKPGGKVPPPSSKSGRIPPPSSGGRAPPKSPGRKPPPSSSGRIPPPSGRSPPPKAAGGPPPAPQNNAKSVPPARDFTTPPTKRQTLPPARKAPPPVRKSQSSRPAPPSKFNGRPPPPSSNAPRGPSGRIPPPSARSPNRPPPPQKYR